MPIFYGGGGRSDEGRIIKVHRGSTTSTSTSSSAITNIFNNTITPAASDSAFYITFRINMSHTGSNSMYMQMLINDSVVASRDDGSDTHGSCSQSWYLTSYMSSASIQQYVGDHYYTHSGSSAFTFTLRTQLQGGSSYLNYSYSYNDDERGYPMSSYTLFEMEPS